MKLHKRKNKPRPISKKQRKASRFKNEYRFKLQEPMTAAERIANGMRARR